MLKSYIKTALRTLLKKKVFSFLNIFGLSLGITCAIIIFLYVQDELTYDEYFSKADRIYRLECTYTLPDNAGKEKFATIGPAVKGYVVQDFPEVIQGARLRIMRDKVIEKPLTGQRFYETIVLADSNVVDLFTLPFIYGNPQKALINPFSAVLSKDMALKYFGRTDVIGEMLRFPEDSLEFQITGVIEDLPSNIHIDMEILISYHTLEDLGEFLGSWWSFNSFTYLELQPNVDVASLESKVRDISRSYIKDQEDGSGYKQFYSLRNIKDIHLHSDVRRDAKPPVKASFIYLFAAIGGFILIIACINFMNLSTAQSMNRAKEVGLRKVAGAFRTQLIYQFMIESLVMTFVSLLISLLTVYFLLPEINNFTGKSLSLDPSGQTSFIIILMGITFTVGIISGSYPSLFLSAFKPSETLKGSFRNQQKGKTFRKTLVVVQFMISIFLITGTIVIYRQLQYMRNINLGFDKERVIVLPARGQESVASRFELLKNELRQHSDVVATSVSSQVPGKEMGNNVVRLGWDDDADWSDMRYLTVDYNFMDLYDIELVAGRKFSEEFGTDPEQAFMLNESAVKRLGFVNPEEAVETKLAWQRRKGVVIGVVKDFHFMSANREIEPFIIVMNGDRHIGYLSVKVSADNLTNTIEDIRMAYRKVNPDAIFEYTFLDEDFAQQYKSDRKFGQLFSFFTGVAMVVACLGLYGLSAFTTEIKFKEIGIRKVLGASVSSILVLLSRDFTKLVVISFLLAAPVAYFVMKNWLTEFPYRTELSLDIFLISGLLALVIALVTISYQSLKASLVNPVKSIGNE